MSSKLKVFVGYDSREDIAWQVCRHSIERLSSSDVEVHPLRQPVLRELGLYTRPIDATASTEFSLTRFLTPYVSAHDGWTLFVDCDFVFTRPLDELLSGLSPEKALYVVQHDYVPVNAVKMDGKQQTVYPRKNWSSFMLFNGSHPAVKALTPAAVNAANPAYLHRFAWVPDDAIGALDLTWNFLEGEYPVPDEAPAAIHFTNGGPWFDAWGDVAFADVWNRERDAYLQLSGQYRPPNNRSLSRISITDMSSSDVIQLCGRNIGLAYPIFMIAGPCVIESEAMTMAVAERLRGIGERLGILIIFKSSFDKANRSSGNSFRGPGLDEGLRILAKVRAELDMPVLTDVHEVHQVAPVAEVVDMLQTPAFLARQTDLIEAVATCGKPMNIKKGQFMAPGDMKHVVAKGREVAAQQGKPDPAILVCERGASFGYNNLVSDMRSLAIMRETGCPVVFDATHSVQLPGGQGATSGGQREFVPVLSRAAVAVGISGVFMETHPDPANAKSDGPNAVPLDEFEKLATMLVKLDSIAKQL